jgi:hypothetical protein
VGLVSSNGPSTASSPRTVSSGSTRTAKTHPPIPNFGSSLSASVDLFTGFRRLATLRSASANVDAADAGAVTQRFQVQLDTKQAFYNALAAELGRVAEAQVRRAEQQLQISVQKLHAGSATAPIRSAPWWTSATPGSGCWRRKPTSRPRGQTSAASSAWISWSGRARQHPAAAP